MEKPFTLGPDIYDDRDALPPELRTEPLESRPNDLGYVLKVVPVTVLCRGYLDVYAEILLISYWRKGREPENPGYMIKLVNPYPYDFRVNEQFTIHLIYDENLPECGSLPRLRELIEAAEAFIRHHKRRTTGAQALPPGGKRVA